MEVENDDMVMNNLLVPLDTPGNELEVPLDILEPQPTHIEMPLNNDVLQPTNRRKKKSIVWDYFTVETVGAGCRRACCKQCKQSFAYSTGSKVAGTSHLKRHIAKGGCPMFLRNLEGNQLSPNSVTSKMGAYTDMSKQRYRMPSVPVDFDADRCRFEVAKMIIMHGYPLHIVEHPGFVAFVENLQPRFDMASFSAVQGDCLATYLVEKGKLQKVIDSMPGRISLTLDLWSSSRTVGYVFVHGHFIDSEWKMHRKLLNVIMEPYPDSDTAFSHSVAACLSDWCMDGKLFSVTINQPISDAAVENLRALFSVKNPLVLGGQMLIGNCLARSLSSIAEDALASMQEVVKKVRDSVKYVKTSELREERFVDLKLHLQVPSSKSLAIDDRTRWNTTYEMLLAASELREVFSCLDTADPDYRNPPSADDWKLIEALCTHLKPLFDTANLLSTGAATTTNTFFHEAWKIQLEFGRAAASEDPFVSTLTKFMLEKFDKYWKSACFVLAIAVVMDPRFKMKLVEFSFSKIYGEEAASYVKTVDDGIHELFLEYAALPVSPTACEEEANGASIKTEDGHGVEISTNDVGLADFDQYIMETTSHLSKSELDQYLEEPLLPRVHEFDVLGWWEQNQRRYPILSKMALDILSIPVCTVPASSVFDTVRKEMDSYSCSLRPETVEALIITRDWLRSETSASPSAAV